MENTAKTEKEMTEKLLNRAIDIITSKFLETSEKLGNIDNRLHILEEYKIGDINTVNTVAWLLDQIRILLIEIKEAIEKKKE